MSRSNKRILYGFCATAVLMTMLSACRASDMTSKGCEIIEWNAAGNASVSVLIRNTSGYTINMNNILIKFADSKGVRGRLKDLSPYKNENNEPILLKSGETARMDLVKTYDVNISTLYCEVSGQN